MRPLRDLALLAPILLLLPACGAPQAPPPPYYAIPSGPSPQRTAAQPGGIPSVSKNLPRNNPEVQYFPPPPDESEFGRGPTPVPRPGANDQPFYTPPPNLGPVTGYGPGGMAEPPGAPPNPPYPRGGLIPAVPR